MPAISSPPRAFQPKPAGRCPLLWAAVAYSGGVFAGSYAWRPPLWWLVAGIVAAASAIYFSRRRVRAASGLALSVLFVLGAFTIQVGGSGGKAGSDLFAFTDGQEAVVTAHVVKEGSVLQKGGKDLQQGLDLQTEQVAIDNHVATVRIGVRASLYSKDARAEFEPPTDSATRQFRYGDRIRFATKLYLPHNYRNPGAFDYQAYLMESGIVALASAKAEEVELLPGSRAAGPSCGVPGFITALFSASIFCGRRKKPAWWTRCWSGKTNSLGAHY